MNQKINKFSYTGLRNSEYTIFVNQIADIVKKSDPSALHLSKPFDKLVLALPNLAKVKAQETSNSLSNKLQDLDNERDILFKGIVAQAKTYSKINMAATLPHAIVLNKLLDKHGRDIDTASYNAETKRLDDFIFDFKNDTAVNAAVAALNLTILFDHLIVVNTEFAKLFMQRNEEEASTEKVNSRVIRAESDKVLSRLLTAIEFCSTEYETIDYAPLVNKINDLIIYYKTQLKARNTRRNNGKDVSEEPEITI